jgi:phage baseplate assembly protein V
MIHPKQSMQAAARKISNMFSRGVVQRVNAGAKTQALQISMMADESRDNIEHAEPYGMTAQPLPGAEVIAGFFGGNRDHGTVLAVFDKRYRPTSVGAGEVCLYNHEGTKILLKNGNLLEITAAVEVKITAPKVTITGDLEVQGDITDRFGSNPNSIHQMRTIYNSHTHPETGSTTNITTQTQ